MELYSIGADLKGGFCRSVLFAERKLHQTGEKKITKNMFSMQGEIPYVGTDLVIREENECEVFLEKKSGGKFRIITTTDLHMMSDPEKDNKTVRLLLRNIAEAKPDLVILTGDIFTTDYPILDAIQFAEMMEKTGVYWCWIFGNHECREDISLFKYSMMYCTAKYPHCLSKVGKKDLFGVGNFAIHLMQKNELIKSLYLFDSGRDILDKYRADAGCPADLKGYDFLKKDQIDWYRRLSERNLNTYGTNKSFMYMHIPLCEYKHVFTGEKTDFIPSGECTIDYGTQFESVGCSGFNSGMFHAILQNGTQAVFAGHDHVNDFCAEYKGVKLVYSQAGGYDGYDLGKVLGAPEEEWQQGVTVTDILPDGDFEITRLLNRRFLSAD